MTTHPTPKNSSADQRGFTLIELLVVIAIIGLLVSITIPIYRVVNEGTNSARSLANLKNIGSTISIYASENNNQLPLVEGFDPLDWTNVTIDLQEEELEKLPYWTKQLMYLGSKSGSDLGRGVFTCPGLRWKDESGKKYDPDDILLAYGVTEAMSGFDEDDELVPTLPRAVASIENKPNTILGLETKQDGTGPTSYSQVTWKEAMVDFDSKKASESKLVDFRFKKGVNCLMADYSGRSIRLKNGSDVEEPNWTGYDYESIE